MRSWGRARKWEGAERSRKKLGDDGDITSLIGILLSKDSTRCSGVIVRSRDRRTEEKACQDNSLGGPPREEDWRLFTNGDQPRGVMGALQLTAMLPAGIPPVEEGRGSTTSATVTASPCVPFPYARGEPI